MRDLYYRTKEVTYETAARNGEPFEALLDHRKLSTQSSNKILYLAELKIKVMYRFMRKIKGYKIGITL